MRAHTHTRLDKHTELTFWEVSQSWCNTFTCSTLSYDNTLTVCQREGVRMCVCACLSIVYRSTLWQTPHAHHRDAKKPSFFITSATLRQQSHRGIRCIFTIVKSRKSKIHPFSWLSPKAPNQKCLFTVCGLLCVWCLSTKKKNKKNKKTELKRSTSWRSLLGCIDVWNIKRLGKSPAPHNFELTLKKDFTIVRMSPARKQTLGGMFFLARRGCFFFHQISSSCSVLSLHPRLFQGLRLLRFFPLFLCSRCI